MTNELAVRGDVIQSLDDIQRMAGMFLATGYFDANRQDRTVGIAQIATKILAGREAGFSPFASVKGIHIIQGTPTFGGHLIATAIARSKRYDYNILEKTNTVCRIEFFESKEGKWVSKGIEEFSAADAKAAGTKNMDKFPRNMLFNRCISNGYRSYCPDVFEGVAVYTPEEMGAQVDDNGDYVEATMAVVDATTGEVEPQPASKETFGHMHALGREVFGDDWRNGIGRDFVNQIIGKETTKGILQSEAEAVIAALREVPETEPTVHLDNIEPLEH